MKSGALALWVFAISWLVVDRTVLCFVGKPMFIVRKKQRCRQFYDHSASVPGSSENADEETVEASKKDMLRFAIPALGIYLANPLMSNIDNGFVGRTAGTAALAAMSPATLCSDQLLYLFSFLGRATTGIVSRAYSAQKDGKGDVEAARNAASARTLLSAGNDS